MTQSSSSDNDGSSPPPKLKISALLDNETPEPLVETESGGEEGGNSDTPLAESNPQPSGSVKHEEEHDLVINEDKNKKHLDVAAPDGKKPSISSLESTKAPGSDATKWSKEMNDLFIDLLGRESQENLHEKNENEWSRESWQRIIRELEMAFPLKAKAHKFERTKLKKHLKIVKDEHTYWRFMKDNAKGFHWQDDKGSFSLDYYGVDHYFSINKFIEDEEVVEKYQKKKSWIKKLCIDHACDYLVKYDENVFAYYEDESFDSNEDEEVQLKRAEETEKKRRLLDDDEDEIDEDDNSGDGDGKSNISNGKATVINTESAINGNKGKEEEIDDDENELLELTGYGKKNPKKHKRSTSPKRRKVNGSVLPNLYFNHCSATTDNDDSILNVNLKNFEKISEWVMTNVLANKITVIQQQLLSKLLLRDLMLFNFLQSEKFDDAEKIKYVEEVTKEYL
ncbi:hypothetical protein DASC09_042260 [Saccharomycopsis crataegensis]|uniref:Myb/SANT-like domain-containing protein n=1 Tax=Saccharomycopsis crataegensis TaxID=43959 RepID=A0AAV5QQQ5_9ASCO|nr:hypothetical protein DASC09_042260 [Saccharomycopsis crataegensis]